MMAGSFVATATATITADHVVDQAYCHEGAAATAATAAAVAANVLIFSLAEPRLFLLVLLLGLHRDEMSPLLLLSSHPRY